MTPLVPLMMLGWIPVGLWLFKNYNGRIACIAGFLIAWGFLPVHNYSLPGIPDYSKVSALGYVMLLGVFMYDKDHLSEFKFNILDLPILLYCSSSFFASVTNGLGAYDGVSAVLGNLTEWYLPYLLGRLYFTDLEALRDLIIGLFIGGLIYIPFCFFEMAMSPNLHRMLYGFHAHNDFSQTRRWGGWRPMVFMKHGLMVAMWMIMASMAGLHLLQNKKMDWLKKYIKLKSSLVVFGLIVTTILCKSMGSLLLLGMGWATLRISTLLKTRLPLFLLVSVPLIYVGLRVTGTLTEETVGYVMSEKFHMPEERVGSLTYRLYNEDMLMEKAFTQAAFGWGGWQRSFVFDETGKAISVPDGMWILVLGKTGVFGLTTMLLTMVIPQFLYLIHFAPKTWANHSLANLGLVTVVMLALFTIDGLLNDMFNPLVLVLAGGLTGLHLNPNRAVESGADPLAVDLKTEFRKPRLL